MGNGEESELQKCDKHKRESKNSKLCSSRRHECQQVHMKLKCDTSFKAAAEVWMPVILTSERRKQKVEQTCETGRDAKVLTLFTRTANVNLDERAAQPDAPLLAGGRFSLE